MALLYPIINEGGEHIGWARSAVDASSFFGSYGNIRDIESEYFVVLDKKGTILVHPITQLEGKNYVGPEVKEQLGADEHRDLYYQKVLAGQDALTTVLGIEGPRERINSGYAIKTGEEPVYFLFLVTPTSSIYSEINEVLFTTRLQNSLLVAAIIGALVALALSIIRWNRSLKREVEHKTSELAESNQALSRAVKSLEEKDETQKQFINTAAHELRTPIQPLLGMADILETQFNDGDGKDKIEVTKPELDMIIRNAKRLERLSSDILEVARIESHSLSFNMKKFDLVDVIKETIKNTQNFLRNREDIDDKMKKNIQVIFDQESELQDGKIIIEGDRGRLTEVIDNLLANAIKFVESDGIIAIRVAIKGSNDNGEGNDYTLVSVKDTGIGIDNEIMSRLFTKFVTKSDQGTGLGLFISRNIVEGHGGKIWAENNRDGKGATFSFTLPITKKESASI
jgi:signal transduction histidine kinase